MISDCDPEDGFFYLSHILDRFFFLHTFISESGFLIMQSLCRRPPYYDDNTVTFSDVITFSDFNLNDGVP